MRLAIVGASGRVGRHLVEQALNVGHSVTALLRDPSALQLDHTNLHRVAADATAAGPLADQLAGHDAVISAVGGKRVPGPRSFITDATRGVIAALERCQVQRLVAIGTKGLCPHPGGGLWGEVEMPAPLRHGYNDHRGALQLLQQSALDWTLICPPHMPAGALSGHYQIKVDGFPRPYSAITTGDVANAALTALERSGWIGCCVGVAGDPELP